MPIYEYQCDACGYRFDILQKAGDPVLTDCPQCSQASLRKLVSAAGFRLSGSGWYETDFKSDNKRNLASGDSQKKSDSTAKPSAKKTDASGQPAKAKPATSGSQQGGRAS
ncbi:MAG: zinc ribbon domain-containing protein [Proteobacteria bacterium]|nr:zinc ribbon domain-containing protein [Pseudomonadota bacterium]